MHNMIHSSRDAEYTSFPSQVNRRANGAQDGEDQELCELEGAGAGAGDRARSTEEARASKTQ
jgi:hypothetical protein